MKIVIDIPEDHKRVIDNLVNDGKGYLLPAEVENRVAIAIKNGIPTDSESAIEKIRDEIEDFREETFHRPNTDYEAYASIEHCLEIIDKHIGGKDK